MDIKSSHVYIYIYIWNPMHIPKWIIKKSFFLLFWHFFLHKIVPFLKSAIYTNLTYLNNEKKTSNIFLALLYCVNQNLPWMTWRSRFSMRSQGSQFSSSRFLRRPWGCVRSVLFSPGARINGGGAVGHMTFRISLDFKKKILIWATFTYISNIS